MLIEKGISIMPKIVIIGLLHLFEVLTLAGNLTVNDVDLLENQMIVSQMSIEEIEEIVDAQME